MATTYEKIASTTLGSAAASITFSSIAASWTDLRLIFTVKDTLSGGDIYLRFNGDSGTNYSSTALIGDGSAASSYRRTNVAQFSPTTYSGGMNPTNPQLYTFDIFSYAGSTYKTLLETTSGDANGSGSVIEIVGLWRSTSAITSIALTAVGGGDTFAIGTTATLYGIRAA